MIVILFDIDGTLISTGGAGKAALEETLKHDFGFRGTIEQVKFSGRTDRAIIRDLFACVRPRRRRRRTNGASARVICGICPKVPARVHQGQVLPGMVEVLAHLRTAERRGGGLLTGNIRAGPGASWGIIGLFDHFDFGGFGDHAPRPRRRGPRGAGPRCSSASIGAVPPERIWVVGDTPLDVQCARAIGAKALAVATGWHRARGTRRRADRTCC